MKEALRKIKGVTGKAQDIARNTLVEGCTSQGAYIQFGRDLSLYNLYEALLYARTYEQQGHYTPGTVQKTLEAVCRTLQLPMETL